MKYAVTFGFTFIVGFLYAQNLVVNPGFEIFKKSPGVSENSLATYGIAGWSQPTAGTADWYCNIEGDSNPIHPSTRSYYFAGLIAPHEGRAFAGIHLNTELAGKVHCEYLTGSLSQSLKAGHTYLISFWIAFTKNSSLAMSRVQVKFHGSKTYTATLEKLPDSASISFDLDTSYLWKKVAGEYIAQGGEHFFTIGNLHDALPTVVTKLSSKKVVSFPYAYYYFDRFDVKDKNPNGSLSIFPGQKLIFNNILFDTGKSSLLASSFSTLDQIVAALKKQSTLKVTINGHTDSDGDPQTNQTLSEQRALSVKKYFVSKGIDSTRISTQGFGSSQPIGTDKSKNRRVEFVFTQ